MKILSCLGSHRPTLARLGLVFESLADRRLAMPKVDNHFHQASFRRLLAQLRHEQHSSGVADGVGAATLLGSCGVIVLECSIRDNDHDHNDNDNDDDLQR